MTSVAQLLALNPLHSSLAYTSNRLVKASKIVSKVKPRRPNRHCSPVVRSSSVNHVAEPAVARRSANYKDCVWDHDYIQFSMPNNYIGEKFKKQMEEMKQQVLVMVGCVSDQGEQLELIDDLQRLGVAYHFEKEIRTMLNKIYYTNYVCNDDDKSALDDADLHRTALACRLFRQHGFAVPQDVFKPFLDDNGKFNSSLCADTKGLISLYEASYLATEGEDIMEEAWTFTTANLSKLNNADNVYLDALLARALYLPLHWRNVRSEARWFIDEAYVKKPKMSQLLHNFGKLDFNIVQAIHLEELRDLSRWWTNLGFEKDLSFARDSLVVGYLWGMIGSPDPQYGNLRKAVGSIGALVSVVDDVYDLYGTLEEVELLTDTFHRWDVDSMRQLPHYMKKCYFACYNHVNELAYEVLKLKGVDVTPYLKKGWEILSSAHLKEARWFHGGYKSTLEEYMSNAWISVAIPLGYLHGHIFDPTPSAGNQEKYLETNPEIVKWACTIIRLADDLGSSPDEMERGDTLKSIQCYMNDTGASKEAAQKHVEGLMRETWKKLNKCVMEEKTLTPEGVKRLVNLVRASHFFYQHGDEHRDGYGVQDGVTKHLMSQVLFDQIPL
ncbi:hypothetical protein QQ045_008502 [Rhodiola kirilowii]